MHVDGTGVARVLESPHVLQQLVTCVDPSRVRGQVGEQIELAGSQVQRLSVQCHSPRRTVYHQVAKVQDLISSRP